MTHEIQECSAGLERAVFLASSAGLILVAHLVDIIDAGGPNWPALGVRICWSALLAALGVASLRAGKRTLRFLGAAACAGTPLLYLALLAVTGRSGSPLFSFSFVLVMLLPFLSIEILGIAVVSSFSLLVGLWLMLVADSVRPGALLGWAHAGALGFSVSCLAAVMHRRILRPERVHARARVQALDLLAKLVHEVSNPLTAAVSSAAYIRHRAVVTDAEFALAEKDLEEALSRITDTIHLLQQDTRMALAQEHRPATTPARART